MYGRFIPKATCIESIVWHFVSIAPFAVIFDVISIIIVIIIIIIPLFFLFGPDEYSRMCLVTSVWNTHRKYLLRIRSLQYSCGLSRSQLKWWLSYQLWTFLGFGIIFLLIFSEENEINSWKLIFSLAENYIGIYAVGELKERTKNCIFNGLFINLCSVFSEMRKMKFARRRRTSSFEIEFPAYLNY